jgi:GAF domain-containing protein
MGEVPESIRRLCEEIAGEREAMPIAHALFAGLTPLMPVTFAAVFVFDRVRHKLQRHAIEKGREVPYSEFDPTEIESNVGLAARTRKEIYIEAEEGARPGSSIPGTETTRSLWFGPMFQDGKLMGVLSVQSSRLGAYGEREKAMLRSLAECLGPVLAQVHRAQQR